MKLDYIDFNNEYVPAGYLLTFRSYGTWLHGDDRGSVDKTHRTYGTPTLPSNSKRVRFERGLMAQQPVTFDAHQRRAIDVSIKETCTIRKWCLWSLAVRTNHVHAVVTANRKPEAVLSALKANATRAMRESGCWKTDQTPWAYRGSKRYLWTEKELADAVAYVEYGQGLPLP
jgi:REP element-mobilizing transposase RayT